MLLYISLLFSNFKKYNKVSIPYGLIVIFKHDVSKQQWKERKVIFPILLSKYNKKYWALHTKHIWDLKGYREKADHPRSRQGNRVFFKFSFCLTALRFRNSKATNLKWPIGTVQKNLHKSSFLLAQEQRKNTSKQKKSARQLLFTNQSALKTV